MEYQLDKWKRQDWQKNSTLLLLRDPSKSIRSVGCVASVGTGERKTGTVNGAPVRSLRRGCGNF